MHNVSNILALWPTDADFGRDIGVPYPTVSAWKQRGSIPAPYWSAIVLAARRRGHPEVTADLLAELHARKPANEGMAGFAEEGAAPVVPPGSTWASNEKTSLSGDGHFSRWKHLRRPYFGSAEDISAHIDALRQEWERR
jgi:hypothetical protein